MAVICKFGQKMECNNYICTLRNPDFLVFLFRIIIVEILENVKKNDGKKIFVIFFVKFFVIFFCQIFCNFFYRIFFKIFFRRGTFVQHLAT